MTTEPRKASDVLLEIESKLDSLIKLISNVDNNSKIISNKLNELAQTVSKMSAPTPKFTAETTHQLPTKSPIDTFQVTDPERQVPISADHKLPETVVPKAFRRTSRPDALEGDNAYRAVPTQEQTPKFPVQMPKGQPLNRNTGEVVIPAPTPAPPAPQQAVPHTKNALVQNAIPVMQRVVDKNNKTIFLADVEITDLSSAQPICKARTNGSGKWMASLGVGAYRVTIRKGGSQVKDKMEAVQDIQVTGNESPLELPTLIVR